MYEDLNLQSRFNKEDTLRCQFQNTCSIPQRQKATVKAAKKSKKQKTMKQVKETQLKAELSITMTKLINSCKKKKNAKTRIIENSTKPKKNI